MPKLIRRAKYYRRIKCRFCDWSTMPWFTRVDGTISGSDHAYHRLHDHYINDHPEILQFIEHQIEDLEVLHGETGTQFRWY